MRHLIFLLTIFEQMNKKREIPKNPKERVQRYGTFIVVGLVLAATWWPPITCRYCSRGYFTINKCIVSDAEIKFLCFATLAPQIFCPHPSFPTFSCLYLVPTGWYEVGVDVQSRKRWRRWVYRSAISLEWVIRVDQWSRVEVTGWSQNFDRGPHIITRLSRHGRRRWKILGQTNVQNTQLHTHYCKLTIIVYICIWICRSFVCWNFIHSLERSIFAIITTYVNFIFLFLSPN